MLDQAIGCWQVGCEGGRVPSEFVIDPFLGNSEALKVRSEGFFPEADGPMIHPPPSPPALDPARVGPPGAGHEKTLEFTAFLNGADRLDSSGPRRPPGACAEADGGGVGFMGFRAGPKGWGGSKGGGAFQGPAAPGAGRSKAPETSTGQV